MKDSIVVRLKGGLGNQLFQLTALNYYSRKYSLHPYYETRRYLSFDQRNVEIADVAESMGFEKIKIFRGYFAKTFKESSEFTFLETLNMRPKMITLDGYFQNPNYLEATKSYALPILAYNCTHAENAALCGCPLRHAAIHVRRGDYTLPVNSKLFGVLSDEYFSNQIKKLTSTHIQIFSDSQISEDKFICPNDSIIEIMSYEIAGWEVLSYFSSADILVMSNSSLSWWGAQIGKFRNENMKIVCPGVWFRELEASNTLIGANWELVEPSWM